MDIPYLVTLVSSWHSKKSIKKIFFSLLCFVFLIAISCSDSSDPDPKGKCRLSMIIQEHTEYGTFKQIFHYNDKGLLVGYNLPSSGSDINIVLEYDGQSRLKMWTETEGDVIINRIIYNYPAPHIVEGRYLGFNNVYGKLTLYYNTNNRLDSSKYQADGSYNYTISRFQYSNGNLIWNADKDAPCCLTRILSDATYDEGIDPLYLLKESANHLGFESVGSWLPNGISIISKNNRLRYRRIWEYQYAPEAPIITEEHHSVDTKTVYAYYADSPYLKTAKYFSDEGEVLGEFRFVYDSCE